MARLSMNQLTTYRWSFDEDLHHARQAGYDGLGVWVRKLRDFGEERAVDLVAESGLRVSCVSWEGGFTGADALTAEENLASARDTLALCAELGAECLVIYTGGRNGHTRRHADRLIRSALDRLLPFAEEQGVPLAVEPMHPACAEGWTTLTTLEEALRFAEGFESPALRLALDTYHFPAGEEDWPLLRELAAYLSVVHLGDADTPHGVDQARSPLGEGAAPLGGIVNTLLEAGYEGFFDVKLLGPAFAPTDYHQLLRQSRRVFETLGGDALRPSTPLSVDACKAIW